MLGPLLLSPILIFAIFTPKIISSQNIFGSFSHVVNEQNVLQMYIPTISSANEKCKNNSLYYAEELRNMKLWATEMFDASGKMPSGILYGSSHDLGNFDECIEIKVPLKENAFSGQYCMAQFTISPPKDIIIMHGSNYYEKNDYAHYYNESMWEKLTAYSDDETKGTRNVLYFAFCLPSSCNYQDFQIALEENLERFNNNSDFQLKVDVEQRSCQRVKTQNLTIGDILFIIFVTISIITVICSSIYGILIIKDTYKHLQFSGKLHDIIMCFSLPTNFKKFTSKGRNLDGLDCLAGMRVYSMILIIVVHRIMFEFGSPMMNPKFAEELYTKIETALLMNGPVLVETFFTLSGFLATYLILAQLKNSKKPVNLLFFYVHRIVRMSPTYAIVIAFYCTLFVKIGSGPFWEQRVGLEQERCLASWWANLLYINNYVNIDKICMFQSWYVTCDMNFFLLSPILAWILWKKPKLGLILVTALIISSIVVIFAIVYINNLEPLFKLYIKVLKDPVSHNSFKTLYIPGHMRASSYFVGVFIGYLKHYMNDNNKKIPQKIVRFGWILSIIIMFAALYVTFLFYIFKVSTFVAALYASLYHVSWSICIAWMVIAISFGHGPWIDSILKWQPLVVLSRLTYCVYISHGIIQIYTAATIRTPVHTSIFSVGYQTAADTLLAYILAFILTMLYESPIIALEKVILRGESPIQNKSKSVEEESSTEMA